jgi:hypothetical protein
MLDGVASRGRQLGEASFVSPLLDSAGGVVETSGTLESGPSEAILLSSPRFASQDDLSALSLCFLPGQITLDRLLACFLPTGLTLVCAAGSFGELSFLRFLRVSVRGIGPTRETVLGEEEIEYGSDGCGGLA